MIVKLENEGMEDWRNKRIFAIENREVKVELLFVSYHRTTIWQ